MLISIHPKNPESRKLQEVVDCLKKGGIIIYPTDTVYGLGCDITQQAAVDKICKIKNIDTKKNNLSFICSDLSHLADYTKHIEKDIYKIMKAALPGPFTFIVEASNNVPKLFKNNKKTVGIRVPNNIICKQIVEMLGNPLLTTSLPILDEDLAYTTDPELIAQKYNQLVNIIIDGGIGGVETSTVIDCTTKPISIIREGAGNIEELGIEVY